MARRLFRTLRFPMPVEDPRALAEQLVARARASSIVGSGGEQELRFVAPGSLVVVIDRTEARFSLDESAHLDEDPEGDADEIALQLEILLGIEEEEGDEGEAPAQDDSDRNAAVMVGALLERDLLELSTPRSRDQVEGRLAHLLAQGVQDPARLSAAIVSCSGVAELYADDDTLGTLIDSLGDR